MGSLCAVKGSSQESNSESKSTYKPSGKSMKIYEGLIGKAQEINNLPFVAYDKPMVAGMNDQQKMAVSNINSLYGSANPWYDQARDLATRAGQPVTAADISRFMDPYTQSVVDATQRMFRNNNAEQMQDVLGNAATQGALGGNRMAVAQGETARQQRLAQDPIIAGLYSQGYGQALNQANVEKAMALNTAQNLGSMGSNLQTSNLQGANAQFQAGTHEQATDQAKLEADYNEFIREQDFPYKQASFLTNMALPIAGAMGGTTTGTQSSTTTMTPAQPSPFSQILGAGMAGVGMASGLGWAPLASSAAGAGTGLLGWNTSVNPAAARGGRIRRDMGGGVPGYSAMPDSFSRMPFMSNGDFSTLANPIDPFSIRMRPATNGYLDQEPAPYFPQAQQRQPDVPIRSVQTQEIPMALGYGEDSPSMDMAEEPGEAYDPYDPNQSGVGHEGLYSQDELDAANAGGEDLDVSGMEDLGDSTTQSRGGNDWWLPLTMAGLGMMAGDSPNAMQNIGAGALMGMQQWSNMRKQRVAELAAAQRSKMAAYKLLLDYQQHKERMGAPTALMKNIQAAGIDPSSPDGQAAMLRAITKPTVEMNAEKKSEEVMAVAAAKRADEIYAENKALKSKISTLSQMEALSKDPNVYQGPGADQIDYMKRLGQSLGIDENLIAGADNTQVFNALANRMALSLRNPAGGEGMPGAMSDADREFLRASVPSLTRTPEGNQRLIEVDRRLTQRKMAENSEELRYIENHGTRRGLEEHMAAWAAKQPDIFKDLYTTASPARAPNAPKYSETATSKDGRKIGFNPATKQWEEIK